MATTDSDDGVRILHLQEGSVVIVLPPTNTETRRYHVPSGEVLDSDPSSVRSSELYSTTATYCATPVSRSDPSSVRFLELTSMTTTSSDTPLCSSDPSTVRSSEFTSTTAANCVTSVFVREDQETHSSELTSMTKASSVTHVPGSGAGHFNGHDKVPISRFFPEMHHGKIVYERADVVATCDTGVSSETASKDRPVCHLSWTPEMREDGTDRFAEGFNLTVKEEEKKQLHLGDGEEGGRGSGEDVLKKFALGTHSKTVTVKCAADQRTVQSYTGHYEHTGDDFEESSPRGMSKGCSNPDDTERNDRNRTGKIPSNVPKQGDAYQSDASIKGNGHAWPMFSGEEDFRQLGNMPADDSNQEVGIDWPFVTVLSTGVTRISVKQPRTTDSWLEVAERPIWTKSSNKIANSHNMNSPEGDSASSSCSPDSPKNAEPNEMLFTTHAWDFLHESDRSLEHEEQQADFVFDVDTFTGESEEPGNGTHNFFSATDTIPTAVIREDQGGISAENVEETSGGEWFLSGRTFSRAMWRSVSAEVNQLNPYFTSGVRLHRVSALELHQHPLSSSDEDLSRRQRPTPMFSRFRLGAGMVPRKENRSKQARNSSLIASTDRNDSGQSKQAKQVLGEEVGPTNRYLRATLSLAEAKRSKRKSSSDHLSAQMECNEPEFEDKASAGKKPKRQRGSVTKAEQGKRRAEPASEQPCSPEKPRSQEKPCSSEKPFSQKNARREKRTTASPRNGSTEPAASRALPVQAASKQSSSELTSSDSQWPAVQLTSDRTDGSDSARAVFFVPQRALPRDGSGSSGTARAQGEAAFNLRQNDGQESPSVLHTETSHSKNSQEIEERKVHPAVKRSTRRAKLTAKRAAVRNRTNSFAGNAQPTVTGTGFTNRTDSDTDKSELEKSTDSDAAKNSQRPDTTVRRSGRKLKPSPLRATLPAARTSSSVGSCSDRPSDNSHQQESDSDHKTQLSRSSSNGFFTSESEVGPLVTFPRALERGWKKRGRLDAVDLGHHVEELSAAELRRRFSAEEYVPASPFATCLRRHPSNLSEGAAPLFLQPHVRSSHVRQLSMDIGEEWENANCPTPLLPPTSPLCLPDDGDDDSVFFDPSAPLEKRSAPSSGEWIPLAERRTSAQPPSGEKRARKKTHQTSAKLRLLYPNPADPKRSEFSEERKREILSTLTAAELLRLRKAGSPLLTALREEGAGVEGGSRAERMNEVSVESERKKQHAPPTSIHSARNKPVLTVQPMPQVASAAGRRQVVPGGTTSSGSNSNGNTEDGQRVTVAMLASDGRYNVEALPASKRCLLPNPFNRLNQRCHSTLQCPCCLFFCFLCCLPALFFMSRSDYEFDFGSLAKAKRYGRWTTTAYVVGAAVAVGLMVASVVATVLLLQDTLLEERGWS